jgi:hypothetical protein
VNTNNSYHWRKQVLWGLLVTGIGAALLQSAGRGIDMDTPLKVSMFVLGVVFYGLTVLANYLVTALRARRRSRESLF